MLNNFSLFLSVDFWVSLFEPLHLVLFVREILIEANELLLQDNASSVVEMMGRSLGALSPLVGVPSRRFYFVPVVGVVSKIEGKKNHEVVGSVLEEVFVVVVVCFVVGSAHLESFLVCLHPGFEFDSVL